MRIKDRGWNGCFHGRDRLRLVTYTTDLKPRPIYRFILPKRSKPGRYRRGRDR